VRVHDVKEVSDTVKICDAILRGTRYWSSKSLEPLLNYSLVLFSLYYSLSHGNKVF
jgi:hypothetical protein